MRSYSQEFLNNQNQIEDLTGKRFGRLLVWELGTKIKPRKHTYWICKCDCGKLKKVRADSLKNGRIKSCGCFHIEILRKGKTTKEIIINTIFSSYRYRAKNKFIIFKLSLEDFKKIIFSNCYYCGTPPINIQYHKNLKQNHISYNGIDRKNCNLGYIKSNIVPCCKICNRAKGVLPTDKFIEWILRLYKNISKVNK